MAAARGVQWKLSCVMFRGIYYEQGTPDSTAAGRHQAARVGGCVEIHTGLASLLSCHVVAHQAHYPMNVLFTYCMRVGPVDKWLHYADICPNGMDVWIHSSSNVLISSAQREDFWEEEVITSCIISMWFCYMIRSPLNRV